MRKNIVAGNWKMNTTLPEGVALAKEVNEALKGANAKCDVIVCVPFTHLASVKAVIDSELGLGAENVASTTARILPCFVKNSLLPLQTVCVPFSA